MALQARSRLDSGMRIERWRTSEYICVENTPSFCLSIRLLLLFLLGKSWCSRTGAERLDWRLLSFISVALCLPHFVC